MDMADIRRRNLQLLVDKYESQQEVADIVKISPQYLSQLLSGHRNIGEKTARKIEAAVKIPRLTLDIEPGMSESSNVSVPWGTADTQAHGAAGTRWVMRPAPRRP
jgi:transcriptional regulator with XRE-family HTH domain